MNPSKFSDEIKSVEKTCGAYLKTVLERCAKVKPNDRLSAAKLTAKLAKCIKRTIFDFCADKISFFRDSRYGRKLLVSNLLL